MSGRQAPAVLVRSALMAVAAQAEGTRELAFVVETGMIRMQAIQAGTRVGGGS